MKRATCGLLLAMVCCMGILRWGYCVILYCATNATFGDICRIARQCGERGLKAVYTKDDDFDRDLRLRDGRSP